MIQESSKDPYHAMKIRIENFGESDLRRFANSISEVVRVYIFGPIHVHVGFSRWAHELLYLELLEHKYSIL